MRRTPLAWEVRKTSPCRIWNSTIIQKSTSPLQRASPTESICKSPVEQITCECKTTTTDNKVNNVKEELLHKLLKDNKNNVCKSCSSDIKERRKNGVDKVGNQTTNKEKSVSTKTFSKVLVKQSVQSKMNLEDRRTLNEGVTYDSKNKVDSKNIPKHTKDSMHGNIIKLADSNLSAEKQEQAYKNVQLSTNCELAQKDVNAMNAKDSKTEGKSVDSKLCNKSSTVLGKNEINVRVKKNSVRKSETNIEKLSTRATVTQSSEKINQVNCQMSKHSHEISDKSDNKDMRINSTINSSSNNADKASMTFDTNRPAYSSVSQTRSKAYSSTLSETPKFTRSKTCLSGKNLPTPSKTRPGTSVIVRGRFQTLENKVCCLLYIITYI